MKLEDRLWICPDTSDNCNILYLNFAKPWAPRRSKNVILHWQITLKVQKGAWHIIYLPICTSCAIYWTALNLCIYVPLYLSIYLSMLYKVTDSRLLTPTPDPYQSQNLQALCPLCVTQKEGKTHHSPNALLCLSNRRSMEKWSEEIWIWRGEGWNEDRNVRGKRRGCAHRHKAPINHRAVLHASCDKWNRIMVSVRGKIWGRTALAR